MVPIIECLVALALVVLEPAIYRMRGGRPIHCAINSLSFKSGLLTEIFRMQSERRLQKKI